MSTFIEEFYYGNIEPQEVNSELTPKLKKKLSNLAEKEEQLTARLKEIKKSGRAHSYLVIPDEPVFETI
ncbi:MAG: hypothetical protein IKA56_04245 [Clostridia bacterium]|nr:hypothetical protein [Clostridia bacterium]